MRRINRLAIATVACAVAFGASAAPSLASSHREAPLIAGEPQLDNTDLYAFVSPDKSDTVTIIANCGADPGAVGRPELLSRSPNNARYKIHIDNNDDAKADLTYRWRFKSSYRDPTPSSTTPAR